MNDARKRYFQKVIVWRFDRFARSTRHLTLALEEFQSLGIDFISYQENIDTGSPIGRAMFTMISALSQLERDVIREQGAYALSFVLRLEKAIKTGIFIVKAFTHLRRFILKNENLMVELKNNDHLSKTFTNFEKRIEQDLVVLYKNTSKFEKRFKCLEEEIKNLKKTVKS